MVLGSGCCVGKLFGVSHLLTHSLLYLFHSLYVCADVCVYVRICVCASASMCSPNHPECPTRITSIWSVLESEGYVERCVRIQVSRSLVAVRHAVGAVWVCLYMSVCT